MSYLARLKTKLGEKQLLRELPKLPKGASVSFVSSHGGGFCRIEPGDDALHEPTHDVIEERRAIIAETCPAPYADTFARLNHQKPFTVSTAEWSLAVNDAGLFLDKWGTLAADMQWSTGDLFDVPREGRPGGLIWRLRGERVEALGWDNARLSDGRTIMRGEA